MTLEESERVVHKQRGTTKVAQRGERPHIDSRGSILLQRRGKKWDKKEARNPADSSYYSGEK